MPSWESTVLDSDMAFAAWMRETVLTLFTLLPSVAICLNYRVTSCMSVISMTTGTS